MVLLVLAFLGSTAAFADEPPLVDALQQLGAAVGAEDGAPDVEALLGGGTGDLGDLLGGGMGDLGDLLSGGMGDLGDLLGDSASGGLDLGGLLSGSGADLASILGGTKASTTKPAAPNTSGALAPPTSFGTVPDAGPARLVVVGERGEAAAALSLSGDHRVVPVLLPGVHVTRVDGGDVPADWASAADACLAASPGGRLVLRVSPAKAEVMFEETPGDAAPVLACLAAVPDGAWQITRAPSVAKSASGGIVVHH